MDFRTSLRCRRQSWFGLKRHVKRTLALPLFTPVLRLVVKVAPSLRQGGRLPAPSNLAEVEGRVDGARFVMLEPARCENAKELYWGDGRLPRPSDALALDLFAGLAKEADIFIDVGAYTGLFTLAAAVVNPTIRGHAFEIVPEVFETLERNCERNAVTDRVTPHMKGVGEEGASMTVPTGAGGSALPSFYSSRLRFEDGVVVPFRSLDSLMSEIPMASRVVMKVDVEGTENEVFKNGRAFLDAFKPDIVCEVLHGVADTDDLEALFPDASWYRYLIRSVDIQVRSSIRTSPAFRDWLFTTRTPEELLALGVPVVAGPLGS